METIIDEIDKGLSEFKNKKCKLDVEGGVSFNILDKLLDFRVNSKFELVLVFPNIAININLAEVYSCSAIDGICKILTDSGSVITLKMD